MTHHRLSLTVDLKWEKSGKGIALSKTPVQHRRDQVMSGYNVIWSLVGVLLIVALLIWIF